MWFPPKTVSCSPTKFRPRFLGSPSTCHWRACSPCTSPILWPRPSARYVAHKADTPAAAPTSHPRRRRRSSRAASVESAPARSSHRRGTCTCHRACGCRPSLKRAYWAIRPTRTASRPRARHFKPTVPNRGVRLLVKRLLVKRLLVTRLAVDRFCRTASISCCSPCARVRRSETARGCRRDHPLSAASWAPREHCAHTCLYTYRCL